MNAPAGKPKPDRFVLLESLRENPWDWHPMDVERLLVAWNFYRNPGYQSQWGEQHFIHSDHNDLDVVLPMNDQRVHANISLHVVRVIDRLIARTAAPHP